MRSDGDVAIAERVPVTVIVGFLGAGKTTLLKRLLENPRGERLAVLVNDFGAVNIDAALVETIGADQVALSNGCICCSIRDDLAEAVTRTLDAGQRPDRLIVEASGVSRPLSILSALEHDTIAPRVAVDATVCLIDTDQFPALDYAGTELAIEQAVSSDLLLLNKCDVAAPHDLAATESTLTSTMPDIRRVRTAFADVPRELLFGFDPAELASRRGSHTQGAHVCDESCDHRAHGHDHAHAHAHRQSHADEFEAWSWSRPGPVDEAAFRRAVRALPANLLRAKGIVATARGAGAANRLVFQLVGRRSSVVSEDGPAPPLSQVVAIARTGTLDRARLDALFNASLA